MAAATTIQDLPDDMLHEIFERVFDEPNKPLFFATRPPEGAHAALRCVCRRWRDIADWLRLSTSPILVDTSALADVGAVRARHPAATKRIALLSPVERHTTTVSRAASSLINGSADVRRAMLLFSMHTCCLPALVPAVTPIASCTTLTELRLVWAAHKKERAVPFNVFEPLSALRVLNTLEYTRAPQRETMPTAALLAPLPALPDAPRLTCLRLRTVGNFVPVGSDAALGRLRRLEFEHKAPVKELLDAEDPFLLRAAFDAGTWQPSRLTGLQELQIMLDPVHARAPVRLSQTRSRPGSEWAPLADQVTSLSVVIKSDGYRRPSTGIVAGLGALTALRSLRVAANAEIIRAGWLEPMSIDRVRAPLLTHLELTCVSTPVSVDRFPNLVRVSLISITRQPPLNLRSLVARSTFKSLAIVMRATSSDSINLAELFVNGAGWPVLEQLMLVNAVLEWDATGLAGAPTAAEFAERARQLLPALIRVAIHEPSGRGALPDRSRVGFVVACRRHVVPALLGLSNGQKWPE